MFPQQIITAGILIKFAVRPLKNYNTFEDSTFVFRIATGLLRIISTAGGRSAMTTIK